MNIQLLNRLAIMEHHQLKGLCPFLFKGVESKYKEVYLEDFHIHNDYLHIKNQQYINNSKQFLWQPVLYFKNGYDQKILLFDYLQGKYKLK